MVCDDRPEADHASTEGCAEESEVLDRLLTAAYDDLRRRAAAFLNRERPGHSLVPTELVHQAYERLAIAPEVEWQGRTHFLATAARVMRQVLVDHARRRGADKRGPGRGRVTLSGLASEPRDVAVEELLEALDHLEQLSPRQHEIIVHRFFGGLGVDEVARATGVSIRTVVNDSRVAIAWLRSRLE